MWRASREMPSRRGTPGRTAGFPVGKPEFFAFEGHGLEVENTIVGDGGLEPVRVSDEPIDGVSSVARARDTLSLWIDEPEPRHRSENGIEVNHHLAAPALRDLIHESLPETREPRGFGAATIQPCAAHSAGFQRDDHESDQSPCGPP